MSLLIPRVHVERSMRTLASQLTPTKQATRVKEAYIDALNTMQPVQLVYSDTLAIRFDANDILKNILHDSVGVTVEELSSTSFLMDDRQQAYTAKLTAQALEQLEQVDSSVYDYTLLLTNTLFFCNAAQGGGSLAQNVGLVWFSPKKHWTVEFMAENLYHEALHQVLFLEDMVHGLFADVTVLSNSDYLVTSNFLDVKRPFDLAFHGVFVAAELVHFYDRHHNAERVSELLPKLKQSLKEMDDARERAQQSGVALMKEYGNDLYERMHAYIMSCKLPA